jgi:hypothetical protein
LRARFAEDDSIPAISPRFPSNPFQLRAIIAVPAPPSAQRPLPSFQRPCRGWACPALPPLRHPDRSGPIFLPRRIVARRAAQWRDRGNTQTSSNLRVNEPPPHFAKSSLKSRNSGFIPRIKASFFSRLQPLICFSLLIAALT